MYHPYVFTKIKIKEKNMSERFLLS